MKLLLLFLVLSPILHAQIDDCQRIQIGNFILLDSINGNTQIKRNKKYQIEIGEKSELKLKLKVEWIDECTYSLKLVKVLKNPNNIFINKDIILFVHVSSVLKERYIESCSSNWSDLIIKRTVCFSKYHE